MNNFIILTPTFNDWQSLNKLLKNIDKNIFGFKGTFKILIINDASTIKPKLNLKNFKNLSRIEMINLKKNLGSQKSICLGLKYLKKKKVKAIITVIDSDGEDDPKKINKLINLAIKKPNSIVTANRLVRTENIFFKFLYKIHLLLTFLFTGKYIDFGNYSSFNSSNLKRLLLNENLWLAYSAGVKKNATSIQKIYASKKRRYFGKSKVKFSFLFDHSFNIISVFKFEVFRNSLIYVLILYSFFLITKNFLFFSLILLIIIFNIMVYYQKKSKINFRTCLGLIKSIKKYKS